MRAPPRAVPETSGALRHLPLGGSAAGTPGHAGLFEDCKACAAYLKKHPKTPVPWTPKREETNR